MFLNNEYHNLINVKRIFYKNFLQQYDKIIITVPIEVIAHFTTLILKRALLRFTRIVKNSVQDLKNHHFEELPHKT